MSTLLATLTTKLIAGLVTIISSLTLLLFTKLGRTTLQWFGDFIDRVLYFLNMHVTHFFATGLALKQYCFHILDGPSRELRIPGRLDLRANIDDLYVPLLLDGNDNTVRSESTVLESGSRVQIIGDPGSGKSTIVKRLLREQCRQGIRHPTKTRLPVLVELKDLRPPEGATSEWLIARVRSDLSKLNIYKIADCFDSCIRTSGVLLLLDGLDEVSSTAIAAMHRMLNELSHALYTKSPRNAVVLTMRHQFHGQVADVYADSFPRLFTIRRFTPTDIFIFLSRWSFKANREENTLRIYNHLNERPNVRDICSNPLVLAMYVAEDQASGHPVSPESRTQFYSDVVKELLIKRRAGQLGPSKASTAVYETREHILGSMAYEHLVDPRQPANSISWESALAAVREVERCGPAKARQRLDEISKDTGIVTVERDDETVRFIHLTFCEFLAAKYATYWKKNGWDELLAVHRGLASDSEPSAKPRLLEVLPFAAGLQPPIFRDKVIEDLHHIADRRLLALSFLEMKAYGHPSWAQFLDVWSREFLDIQTDSWTEETLHALALFSLMVNDANCCFDETAKAGAKFPLDEFFKSLTAKGGDYIYQVIATYAQQDAVAAFHVAVLCGVDVLEQMPELIIDHLDQPGFYDFILRYAYQHSEQRPAAIPRWANVFAEAGLGSPAVAHSLLKSRPLESWSAPVTLPPKKEWLFDSEISGTLYGQCLAYALDSSNRSPSPYDDSISLVRGFGGPVSLPRSVWRALGIGCCFGYVCRAYRRGVSYFQWA